MKEALVTRSYLSNFFGKGVRLVAVLHVHLILGFRLMLVIQLDDIIVIHLFVDAALALCIHPVVLRQKFLLANDFLDYIQIGFLVLHKGHLRRTQRLIIEQLTWCKTC